ncbi:prepilin-type N-terminal cleavage/methylation domain-containing protein [Candidatus Gracilibacteria bacterium]|nr:prepilin-type N-terminal cleavage/methylation domain-containing protein [Candidatus Gracilibacteria bacterium]
MNHGIKNLKGFTLIELMIVIAIIGILAVTLVPQLTGAQGKARDTGRISSLKNASTALVQYQNDYSVFPLSSELSSDAGCLSVDKGAFKDGTTPGTPGNKMGEYLTSSKAPLDPIGTNTVKECGIKGSYGYFALEKSNNPQMGFILTADVETTGQVNYDASQNFPNTDNSTSVDVEKVQEHIGKDKANNKAGNTEEGVYVLAY